MQLAATGPVVILAVSLSPCEPYAAPPYATAIDPEQATERAAGALVGAAVGSGIGATSAISLPVEAAVGARRLARR
jgi:hypothetical protein